MTEKDLMTANETVEQALVHDKIQEAKDCFEDIMVSGYNSFQDYAYADSGDLFPLVRDVCKKFDLVTWVTWSHTEAILHVKYKGDNSIATDTIPLPEISNTNPRKFMQDVGAVRTYARRYLYISIFEIAIPDEIDNKDQRKYKNKPKTNTIVQPKQELSYKNIKIDEKTINQKEKTQNTKETNNNTTPQETPKIIQTITQKIQQSSNLKPTPTRIYEYAKIMHKKGEITEKQLTEITDYIDKQ